MLGAQAPSHGTAERLSGLQIALLAERTSPRALGGAVRRDSFISSSPASWGQAPLSPRFRTRKEQGPGTIMGESQGTRAGHPRRWLGPGPTKFHCFSRPTQMGETHVSRGSLC